MSSRDMTINQIKTVDKDFGAKHTIKVSGFKDGGGRLTAADVQKELRTSVAEILKEIRISNQNLMNAIISLDKKLTLRIDNLVSKNGLKE